MPRISTAWKSYTGSGKYFKDLQKGKISLDPVAKKKAVNIYKKKHGKLPSVSGSLKPITKTMVNKSTKEKTGMKNGSTNNNGGIGSNLNQDILYKFIFPPLGLLGNQQGSNAAGDTVTDTGNIGEFIFPPLGFMGGSGSQAIDTGKQAIDSFDWKKMLLLGGLVLGGLYLVKRR